MKNDNCILSVRCGLYAIHKATGLRWGVSSRTRQTAVNLCVYTAFCLSALVAAEDWTVTWVAYVV